MTDREKALTAFESYNLGELEDGTPFDLKDELPEWLFRAICDALKQPESDKNKTISALEQTIGEHEITLGHNDECIDELKKTISKLATALRDIKRHLVICAGERMAKTSGSYAIADKALKDNAKDAS